MQQTKILEEQVEKGTSTIAFVMEEKKAKELEQELEKTIEEKEAII